MSEPWWPVYEYEPEPPSPCQYCSVMAGVLKEHDGSCDSLTKERWIELTGETE